MAAEVAEVFNLDGTPWRAAEPAALARAHGERAARLASLLRPARREPNPVSLDEGEE